MAALQRKSIKQYTLERVFPDDANGDQAWCELKMRLGARIERRLAGQISTQNIGAITEEELGRNQHS